MGSIHLIDYIVIGAYVLAMLGIGVASTFFAKERDDYLLAGRRLKFPLFFGCMAAMAVGGAVTVGGAQRGYEVGIAGVWVGGSLGLGLITLGVLISSKLAKLRALSINEVIERNYGASARLLGAVLTIIYTVALTVVQVIAMGSIVSLIFTDISHTTAMVVSGAIVVFYTFLGGMWAVTMTDIVQFVIKTLGIMILVPIFLLVSGDFGGLTGLVEHTPAEHWDPWALGFSGTLYWILIYVPGLVIGQDIWQRMFTARNERIARTGTILAGVYSILYGLAAVLLGMAVLAVGATPDRPSETFALGVELFLPPGFAGLLLAAAVAAAMSVASGTILACSTVIYNDVYLRLVRGERASGVEAAADDRVALGTSAVERQLEVPDAHQVTTRDVWINRGIALTIGLMVIGLAVVIEDIFRALDLAFAFLSGCVFVPVIAAFFLRRVSPKAGLFSLLLSAIGVAGAMILGESGQAAVLFGEEAAADWVIGGNYPIMVGMSIGVVVYVVFTLLDPHKRAANVEIDEAHADQLPPADEARR
ncbi:MAG: sodium:solute symporter [Mobilicoccus sp.]|nr:sodium:solute symporter [Mobilicoccus sp.]